MPAPSPNISDRTLGESIKIAQEQGFRVPLSPPFLSVNRGEAIKAAQARGRPIEQRTGPLEDISALIRRGKKKGLTLSEILSSPEMVEEGFNLGVGFMGAITPSKLVPKGTPAKSGKGVGGAKARGEAIPPDVPPLTVEVTNPEVVRRVMRFGADLMVQSKVVPLPASKGLTITQQIANVMRDTRLTNDEVALLAIKHKLSTSELAGMSSMSISDAGRMLGIQSGNARRIDKMLKDMAESDPAMAAELNAALRNKSSDPSWWVSADAVRRSIMVSNFATATRNAIVGEFRVGTEMMIGRFLDIGWQQVLSRTLPGFRMTPAQITPIGDAFKAMRFLTMAGRLGKGTELSNKKLVDSLMSQFPAQKNRMFTRISADLPAGLPGVVADTAMNTAMVFNRFQEYIIRRGVFAAELQTRLSNKGLRLETLAKQAREGNDITSLIPMKDMEAAIDRALDITFATQPNSRFVQNIVAVLNKPGITLITPFPRFMANATRYLYEKSPLGVTKLLSKAQRKRLLDGDIRVLTDATLGTSILLAADQLRKKHGGDKWYEIEVGGRMIDTRAFFPINAGLLLSNVISKSEAFGDGTLSIDRMRKDVSTMLTGIRGTAQSGLSGVEDLLEGLLAWDGTQIAKGGGRFVGESAATFLVFLNQFSDMYAAFDADEAIVRDTKSDDTAGSILNPMIGMIPELKQTLPEARSPETPGTLAKQHPTIRQATGVTVSQPRTPVGIEMAELDINPYAISSTTGQAALDRKIREVVGERINTPLMEHLISLPRYQKASALGKKNILEVALRAAISKNVNDDVSVLQEAFTRLAAEDMSTFKMSLIRYGLSKELTKSQRALVRRMLGETGVEVPF